MYANVRSIVNKMDYFCATVNELEPDIIGITESWVDGKIEDAEINLNGYDMFRCDRPLLTVKGGGVLMYIKSDLQAVKVDLRSEFPEHVWCKIEMRNKKDSLFVGVCYRTPTEALFGQPIHSNLRELLAEVSSKNFMLMGDFNYSHIDWNKNVCEKEATEECRKFLECVQDCFLTQHVHVKTTEKSILDLVLTTEPDLVNEVTELDRFSSSDHNLLSWTINIGHETKVRVGLEYNYKRMDVKGIKEKLRTVDWKGILEGSANESWTKFKSKLQEVQSEFVPRMKIGKPGKRKAIWLTHKAIKSIKRKHRVYKKFKDNKHPVCMEANHQANMEVKKAKFNFEKKLAENIKTDSKSFFSYVKSRSKAKISVGPIVNGIGESINSKEEITEEFNNYFASVFTEETGDVPAASDVFQGLEEDKLIDIVITEEKVNRIMDKLRADKAAGADEMVPRFLSTIRKDINHPLTRIFEKILNEGQVPTDWKEANVIPIFKGGSRNITANYRPVSLTSQLCKVFETLVRDEMVIFLEKHKLIKDSQHGFRKGRSCLSNLLLFLDTVTDNLEKGLSTDVIYLDLAKAFDKVPHKRLLEKLAKHGIAGKVINFVEDWMRNRRQRVCLQGVMSGWQGVRSGVPQGSVLGPLLFVIFINDLDCGIENCILKFADDTKIFGKVVNEDDKESLQRDLDNLLEWADRWQMQFNVKKCKVMHMGSKNRGYDYSMNNINLEAVNVEKDLGVSVSMDIKSNNQCLNAYNKASKVLGMINRTIKYKDPRIMVCLYKTLVRPHLEYCVSAWSPHYSKDKDMLEKVQHRFTRMIKETRKLPYEQRLARLDLWTLEERRNRSDLIEVFKMYKGVSDVNLDEMFQLNSNQKGTRGHNVKLYKERCCKDARKYFFSKRVVDRWNALDQEAVDAPSINAFKNKLLKIWKNKKGFFMD